MVSFTLCCSGIDFRNSFEFDPPFCQIHRWFVKYFFWFWIKLSCFFTWIDSSQKIENGGTELKRTWDNSKREPCKAINLQIVLGQWLSGIFKPQEPSDISICRLETYLQKGSFNICCQCYFVNLNRSKSPQRSSKMTGPRYKHSLRLLHPFLAFADAS